MLKRSLGSALALMCLTGMLACRTAARQLSASATEGALEELRQQKEQIAAEEEPSVPRVTAEQITQGVLDALTRPEAMSQVQRFVDTLVSQSLRSAAGGGVPAPIDGATPPAGPGTGGGGMGPVPRLASEVTRALSAELERQLGPDGTGPLAQSLAATAGEVTASIVRQSRSEFGLIFPECEGLRGEAGRACVEARLAQLGAAFSRGATQGASQALQPWLFVLAFAGGLLVGLLVFLAVSAVRANHQEGGRAGLFRQRRPA